MRNLRLKIAYDGTRYRGWQRLKGENSTIQGKLEAVLTRILGEPVELIGSGRTDAGVHAQGQVANFHCENPMAPGEILSHLRRYLPEDIGILSCEEVGPRFHARLNAREKTYVYRVWNSDEPCVFESRYVYRFPVPLDIPAMEEACQAFLGVHDFAAFCARPMKKSTVRELYEFSLQRTGEELRFTLRGSGFLYNMVRILVGTVLEVGQGKREVQDIPALFQEKKREKAGYTVPARGLCLMEVRY